MNVSLVIPAYAEPMSTAEAKLHLKVESAVTEDDELIGTLITAAREVVEAEISVFRNGRSFSVMVQTWDGYLDHFPSVIHLPRDPLVSVDSITYLDSAGASQTLATSVYSVNLPKNRIDLAYNQEWPDTYDVPNAVTVRFTAGLMATFTAANSTEILTVQGRTFALNDIVRLFNGEGDLPAGLSPKTDYYVLTPTGSAFQVSLTEGGSAVAFTDDGTVPHFIGIEMARFQSIRSAMKLLLGHVYENRESVTLTGGVPKDIPLGFRSLCAAAA